MFIPRLFFFSSSSFFCVCVLTLGDQEPRQKYISGALAREAHTMWMKITVHLFEGGKSRDCIKKITLCSYELGVHLFRLLLEGHHLLLDFIRDELAEHNVVREDVPGVLHHSCQIDGLSEIDQHLLAPLEPESATRDKAFPLRGIRRELNKFGGGCLPVRVLVGKDLVHADVPEGDDDWHHVRLGYESANAPLEADEFVLHVNATFWEDVHPLTLVQALDAEVQATLIHASSPNDRHAPVGWGSIVKSIRGNRRLGQIIAA